MRHVRFMTIALVASFFALTACLFTQPAPSTGNTQITNSQTGASTSGLLANGNVQLRLTVQGDGWVNISPGDTRCGPTTICTYAYAPGTVLTIYTDAPAIPGSNHSFKEWGDACASLGNNAYPNLTVNSSMNCVAKFTPEGR